MQLPSLGSRTRCKDTGDIQWPELRGNVLSMRMHVGQQGQEKPGENRRPPFRKTLQEQGVPTEFAMCITLPHS